MQTLSAPEPRLPLLVRQATAADWPFIRHSWRTSSLDCALAPMGLDKETLRRCSACRGETRECAACDGLWALRRKAEERYVAHHNRLTEALEPRAQCVVVAAEDNPGELLGYVVAERREGAPLVHWLYVKHRLRRLGVGALLLAAVKAQGGRYTTHTRAGARLVARFGLRFTPEELSR